MNKRQNHLQRRSVGLKGSLGLARTKELPHLLRAAGLWSPQCLSGGPHTSVFFLPYQRLGGDDSNTVRSAKASSMRLHWSLGLGPSFLLWHSFQSHLLKAFSKLPAGTTHCCPFRPREPY